MPVSSVQYKNIRRTAFRRKSPIPRPHRQVSRQFSQAKRSTSAGAQSTLTAKIAWVRLELYISRLIAQLP
eukprot:6190499-Pleurochrysis_carterae.AAC.1